MLNYKITIYNLIINSRPRNQPLEMGLFIGQLLRKKHPEWNDGMGGIWIDFLTKIP